VSTPEPCTTETFKKRHLSTDLCARSGELPGRWGRLLCASDLMGYDDAAINYGRDQYARPVVVAELPPCRSCERSAKKIKETNR
jgi:hypothetical protein